MRAKLTFTAMLGGLLLACAGHAQDSVAGIGVALGVDDHAIKILTVFPNTPAYKAGLFAGLVVNRINGVSTGDMLFKDCVAMLRGAVGTKVELELVDAANSKTNTVGLTRERFSVTPSDGPPKPARPAIYDEKADGEKQIADALTVAKKENKRVLLQFGANWCGWCHKLHNLCETNPAIAAKLKDAYVVVLVDVNEGHNEAINKRYDNPTRFGLPVLVVLDADGKALVTQDTGNLEEGDHHDPKKVLAFLNEWGRK